MVDDYFRYKSAGGKLKVGKAVHFYRNDIEGKDTPLGDVVHFREVYHKDSDEFKTIAITDITVRSPSVNARV